MDDIGRQVLLNFDRHAHLIPSRTAGMTVWKLPGLTAVDSGLPCDTFNIVHVHDQGQLQPADLEATVHQFVVRQFPFCVWIDDLNLTEPVQQQLTRLGLTRAEVEPGMVLDLDTYSPVVDDRHRKARIAATLREVADFAEVVARNWTPPDPNVLAYFWKTALHYLAPDNRIVLTIYYENELPVSVIELFPTDDQTIGLYCLATLNEYRGRGIGTALMTFALNKARELGYKTAVLQASEEGIRIYERLGFSVVNTYYEYQ
ncbi:N-acetyltransferase [Fibrisoma montanum]|uniref:N-acetyltransferase n=1 Tax=Fibrisoma montanum TaxID=2305895 RepID=A0A418M730_9BACT|nr:GNAT family N-acetyltransferase [Fibrisoma montanum]RIV21616.1 N-acetyltransferase [Fibrisoma montanum]